MVSNRMSPLEVVPHPFISGAAMIFSVTQTDLLIFSSENRNQIGPIDKIPLKGLNRICGLGIHKVLHSDPLFKHILFWRQEAHVFLLFGELEGGKMECMGFRITGTPRTG